MDKSPVSAQLRDYYRVDDGKLERDYKDSLRNFRTWDQLDHCADWVLQEDNMGPSLCIYETMFGEEVYTIFSGRDEHGKSGTVAAVVQGAAI